MSEKMQLLRNILIGSIGNRVYLYFGFSVNESLLEIWVLYIPMVEWG